MPTLGRRIVQRAVVVAVVLRFLFGKAVAVGVPFALLWVMWKDPGGVRTWAMDLFVDHFVDGIRDTLLPGQDR